MDGFSLVGLLGSASVTMVDRKSSIFFWNKSLKSVGRCLLESLEGRVESVFHVKESVDNPEHAFELLRLSPSIHESFCCLAVECCASFISLHSRADDVPPTLTCTPYAQENSSPASVCLSSLHAMTYLTRRKDTACLF